MTNMAIKMACVCMVVIAVAASKVGFIQCWILVGECSSPVKQTQHHIVLFCFPSVSWHCWLATTRASVKAVTRSLLIWWLVIKSIVGFNL